MSSYTNGLKLMMPGANNTSRRTKGISIFEIPKTSNLTQEEWRNELVNVIVDVIDIENQDLRRHIKEDRFLICAKCFHKDEMYRCKYFFLVSFYVYCL